MKRTPAVVKLCVHSLLDGNGADDDTILQHNTEHQEDEVEEKHGGTQHLIHLPFTGRDGDDDEEEHEKEQHNGTEEPVAADRYWSETVEHRVQEPWDRKAFVAKTE